MIVLHCARVPAALPAPVIAAWLGRLPAARAAAIERGLAKGRSLESLTGLALLASAARHIELPPLAELRTTASGRPHWPGGPEFSISHAGGYAACAIAPAGSVLGLDIEQAGRVRARALRLVTSDEEQAARAGETRDATAHWTGKEAVLKAADLRLADARRVTIADAIGRVDGREFHLVPLALGRGLCGTLATAKSERAPMPRWFGTTQLFGTAAARRRRRA